MRPARLLMDITAELTGGGTEGPIATLDGLTAAPTTRVLPPITMALLRTTTALAPITAAPAFTLVLGAISEASSSSAAQQFKGRSARHRAALRLTRSATLTADIKESPRRAGGPSGTTTGTIGRRRLNCYTDRFRTTTCQP